MTNDEYIRKMKDFGWSIELINEQIELKEEAARDGIIIPLEANLFEAPIQQ